MKKPIPIIYLIRYAISAFLIFTVCAGLNAQQFQWALGPSSASGNSKVHVMAKDPNGKIFSAIYFQGSVSYNIQGYGTQSFTSMNGSYDILLMKSDSSGNVLQCIQLGGNGDENPTGIQIDNSGNVYLAGGLQYNSSDTFFTDTVKTYITHEKSNFLVKYNSSGKCLWSRVIGHYGSNSNAPNWRRVGLDLDGSARPVIVSYFVDSVEFHNGTRLQGINDIYIARFSTAGVLQSSFKTGGNAEEFADQILVDNNGDYIVSGYYNDSLLFGSSSLKATGYNSTSQFLFLAKYNTTSGNWSWVSGGARVSSYDESPRGGIAHDASNNIYITGTFLDNMAYLGGRTIRGPGGTNIYVAKYSSSGNGIWANSAGGPNDDYAGGITYSAGGDIIVSGWMDASSVVYGTNGYAGEPYTFYVAKLSLTSGVWSWVINGIANSGVSYGYGIISSGPLNLYCGGMITGSTTIGSTTLNAGAFLTQIYLTNVCNQPANLSMRSFNITKSTVSLRWDMVGSANSYTVKYREQGYSTYDSVTTLSKLVRVTGLNPNTTYEWLVRSNCTSANSSFSSYQTFTTSDTAISGAFSWNTTIEGYNGTSMNDGDDITEAITHDDSGNVYITGNYRGELAMGDQEYSWSLSKDIFVAKFDSNGVLKWLQVFGNEGQDNSTAIRVDKSGSVYISGYFQYPVYFGNTLLNGGMYSWEFNQFVLKLDQDGQVQWAKQINSTTEDYGNEEHYRTDMDIQSGNNPKLVVTGTSNGTVSCGTLSSNIGSLNDVYVFRYNTSGTPDLLLNNGGSGSTNFHNSVSIDTAGNIYIMGSFRGAGSVGGIGLSNPGYGVNDNIMYLAKYKPATSSYEWAIRGPVFSTNFRGDMKNDQVGNIYLTYGYTGIFGLINNKEVAGYYDNDIYVAKINTSGQLVWQNNTGGTDMDVSTGIDLDAQGNVYITGYTHSDALYFPNFSYKTTTNWPYYYQSILLKYNNDGILRWVTNAYNYTPQNGNNYSHGIAVLNTHSIWIAGYYNGNCSFGNVYLPSSGGNSIFMSKIFLQDLCEQPAAMTGVTHSISKTSAVLSWGVVINNVKGYDVRLRETGASNWTDFITEYPYFQATGLKANTQYEWEVRSRCDSTATYGNYQNFITQPDSGTAEFNWLSAFEGFADEIHILTTDKGADNSHYIGGNFSGYIRYNGITYKGDVTPFVAAMDSNGSPLWFRAVYTYGYRSYQQTVYSLKVDKNGNVYATGSAQGRVLSGNFMENMDGGSYYNASADMFVMKIKNDGTVEWFNKGSVNQLNYNDEQHTDLTLDKSGNPYVVGAFNGSAEFSGTYLTASGAGSGNTNNDIYIVKYSTSGSVILARKTGNNSNEAANSIVVDTNDNIYISGYYYTNTKIGNITLNNPGYDPNEAVQFTACYVPGSNSWTWAKTGSPGFSLTEMALSENADITVTGTFINSPALFGNKALNTHGGKDVFVVRYDKNGNFIWATNLGGSCDDYGQDVEIDRKGNAYILSSFNTCQPYTDNKKYMQDYSSNQLYHSTGLNIVRINNSGKIEWVLGGENSNANTHMYANDMFLNDSTLFFVAGDYDGNPTLTGGITMPNYVSNHGFVSELKYIYTLHDIDTATIKINSVNTHHVYIYWSAVNNVSGYKIRYRIAGSGNWDTISTVWSGAVVSNLSSSSKYEFQIKPIHYGAEGNYTDIKYFYTRSDSAASLPDYTAILSQVGMDGDDQIVTVHTDSLKNIYLGGQMSGYLNMGDSAWNNPWRYQDGFIIKADSNGKVLWVRSVGGNGYDRVTHIQTDANLNVYATGIFEGVSAFGNALLTANSRDVFLVKYDASGTFSWVRQGDVEPYHPNNIYYVPSEFNSYIALDNSSNIYLYGNFNGNASFGSYTLTSTGFTSGINANDLYIVKYNTSGSEQWARKFGTNSDEVCRIIKSGPSNTLYLSGYYQNTTQLGTKTASNPGYSTSDYIMFIAKYDPNANTVSWLVNGTKDQTNLTIDIDQAGNVYVVGGFNGTNKLGGNTLNSDNNSWDVFLAKYTSAGSFSWYKTFATSMDEFPSDMHVLQSGVSYLALHYSPVWWLPEFSYDRFPLYSRTAGAIIKVNMQGKTQWVNAIPKNGESNNFHFALNNDSSMYLTGNYWGTIKFGNIELPDHGNNSLFGIRFMDRGYIVTDSLLKPTRCEGSSFYIKYNAFGEYSMNNIFSVELSSNDSRFYGGNTIIIGTKTSHKTGLDSMWVTIPYGTNPSGTYRIRVLSSNPEVTGSSNGIDLGLLAAPYNFSVYSQSSNTICNGDSAILSSTYSAYGGTYYYQWYKNGIQITADTFNDIKVKLSGKYSMTVKNTDGCIRPSSDTVDFTVNPRPSVPVIQLLTNDSVCSGDTAHMYASKGADSIVWTDNWNQYQTSDSIFSTNSGGTFLARLINSYGCSSAADTQIIYINPVPYNYGLYTGNTTFCKGDSVYIYNAAGIYSGETFRWYKNGTLLLTDTVNNYIYAKDSAEYSLVVTNTYGCSANLSPVQVTVNPIPLQPTINISGSSSICNGDTLRLYTTGNSGSLQWYNSWGPLYGETDTFYNAYYSEVFYVGVTNSYGCSTRSNADSLTVNPSPYNYGLWNSGNTNFCAGDSVYLYYPYAASGESYQWYKEAVSMNSDTNYYIYAKDSAYYTMDVTNSYGCKTTMSGVQVNVSSYPSKPNISVTGGLTVCQGDTVYLTADSGYYQYDWFELYYGGNYGNSRLLEATTSGWYILRVGNSNNCYTYSDTFKVNVNPAPINSNLAYSGNLSFCKGDSVYLYYPYASSGYTYQWMKDGSQISGAVNSDLYALDSGSYRLIVYGSATCFDTMPSITVNVYGLPVKPTIYYNGSNSICSGSSITLYSSTGYTNNYWYDGGSIVGSNVDSITVNYNSKIVLGYANSYGCITYSDTVSVQVLNAPNNVNIAYSSSNVFCDGDSIILYSNYSSGNQWYQNGVLISGATDTFYTAKISGNYVLYVTNGNGCTDSSSVVTVTVNTLPTQPIITYSGSNTLCSGNYITLRTNPGYQIYSWFKDGNYINGQNDSLLVTDSAGSYKVMVSDINGCSSVLSDSVDIIVNPSPAKPSITYNGLLSRCDGDTLYIHSNYTNGNQWYDGNNVINGATDSIYMAVVSGNYFTQITNSYGCTVNSDTLMITFHSIPNKPVLISSVDSICSGDSVTLDVSNYTSGVIYSVYDDVSGGNYLGNVPLKIAPSGSKTYYVEAVSNGCVNTGGRDSKYIQVNTLPNIPIIYNNGSSIFCEGDSSVLSTGNYVKYQWYRDGSAISGAVNNQLVVKDSGLYTLVVYNASGCVATSGYPATIKVNSNHFNTSFSESQRIFFNPPFTVSYTNNTPNKTNYDYTWYFGDGTTSSQSDPFHTYTTNDTFTVILVAVSKQTGCKDSSAIKSKWIITTGSCSTTATIINKGPIDVCAGNNYTLHCNSKNGYTYQWMNYGADISGANDSTLIVTQSGSYTVRITEGSCVVISKPVIVNFRNAPAKPVISSIGSVNFCVGGYATLNVQNVYDRYLWNNGDTTATTQVYSSGYYTVTVRNIYGCVSVSDSFALNATAVQPVQICKVTVDTTGRRNQIIWTNPQSKAIDSIIILRETNTKNVFLRIGAVSGKGISEYYDNTSLPYTRSYNYKLMVKDTCGQLSLYSDSAKTVFMQAGPTALGYGWNLDWNEYRGLNEVQTYRIYRKDGNKPYKLVTELPGGSTKYTDTTKNKNVKYVIAVLLKNTCKPGPGLGNDSLDAWSYSNEFEIDASGIHIAKELFSNCDIYPNPNNGNFVVSYQLSMRNEVTIKVFNKLGELVYFRNLGASESQMQNFDMSHLADGLYIIQLSSGEAQINKRIIITK